MPTGGLNDIEKSAFDVALNAGGQADGGAVNYCIVSIAISLKRIADVAEQFGDHPDNRNAYGESGMAAVVGELSRFKNEVLNDVSVILRDCR